MEYLFPAVRTGFRLPPGNVIVTMRALGNPPADRSMAIRAGLLCSKGTTWRRNRIIIGRASSNDNVVLFGIGYCPNKGHKPEHHSPSQKDIDNDYAYFIYCVSSYCNGRRYEIYA